MNSGINEWRYDEGRTSQGLAIAVCVCVCVGETGQRGLRRQAMGFALWLISGS